MVFIYANSWAIDINAQHSAPPTAYRKLLEMHFAVGLRPDQYHRKQVAAVAVASTATYTTDETGKLYQPYDEPGECYCCTRTVTDGGKYCDECQRQGAGKEVASA